MAHIVSSVPVKPVGLTTGSSSIGVEDNKPWDIPPLLGLMCYDHKLLLARRYGDKLLLA